MKLFALALVFASHTTMVSATSTFPAVSVSVQQDLGEKELAKNQRLASFPTGYAPCAGDAQSIKEAAYECLSTWKPAMKSYPSKVVYHFSPSLRAEQRTEITKATEFTLTRTQGFLDFMGQAPRFHLFFNIDGQKECERMAKSWKGTKTSNWIWERGVCSTDNNGGQSTGSSIRRTGSAMVNVSADRADWWIYHGMPHEVLVDFFGSSVEQILGSKPVALEVGQMWVFYLASRAAWQASGIQFLGESLEEYHSSLLPSGGSATWQPTVRDPRFCPQGNSIRATRCGAFDWSSLMAEHPWNYAVMDLASEFVTATFGPEWVQRTLWPAMVREYARGNGKYPIYQARGNFRAEMNNVAKRLWGGKWIDLENAIDRYVVSEFKLAGVTGLE